MYTENLMEINYRVYCILIVFLISSRLTDMVVQDVDVTSVRRSFARKSVSMGINRMAEVANSASVIVSLYFETFSFQRQSLGNKYNYTLCTSTTHITG